MASALGASSSAEILSRYEVVIGLEVHVQLGTRTKIFCSCPVGFGAAPNANVCPVCLGLPGALPVLNRQAVALAVKAALALNCTVHPFSRFARKNYFYPDLPKGYQISQYDQPVAEQGHVDLSAGETTRRIGVTRVHMEDDAGKSIHDGFRDSESYSYVDLNRSGTPLIEIVSEPDMRSSDEAYAYMTEIRQIMQFLDVSSCDMEKGQLRCDANISIRPKGATELGTKVEIKNLNSFRFLKLALDYEIERQAGLADSGSKLVQETRLYNPDSGETISMRSKEHAHDYRYFPEPDLVPLRIGSDWLDQIRTEMPELPAQKRSRFVQRFGLREYDAQILSLTRASADYFDRAAAACEDAKTTANWIMGDLTAALNADGLDFSQSPVSPEHLGELIALIRSGEISGKLAKEIFPRMYSGRESARTIIDREGLRQISDSGELEKLVDDVLAKNPKQVEQYRSGKTTVAGFLVGQVMKASRGQANPQAVNDLIRNKLQ